MRFEIGPEELDIWLDDSRNEPNKKYFNEALSRALSIFKSAFSDSDEISIVYQIFSDGRKKIRKNCNFLKEFPDLTESNVDFSTHRDIYSADLEFNKHCWKRVTVSNIKPANTPVKAIVAGIINSDFRIQSSIYGEVYFLNHQTGVVCHLYDDRGMDIVASSKEPLQKIYNISKEYILEYNRDEIERVFN